MAAVESIALLSSSAFAAVVADKLFSEAVEELGLQCGVQKELDRVRSLLKAIGPALEDTAGWSWSSTPHRNLADVACELDDSLDELEWEARQSSSEAHGSSFSAFSYRFLFGSQLSDNFKAIVEKLEAIVGGLGPLGTPAAGAGGGPIIDPKSRSFNAEFFSDKDWGTNKMVALLLESGKGISVLVVQGCGGFGKTTLMKQVYKDGRVRKHFDLRIWLSASGGPAGSSVLDSIVVEDANELDSYGAVSVKLRDLILLGETSNELSLLAGRRFLLVLDDVQDEHLHGWDDLCRNLIAGEEGSKVVVTTRSSDLAKTVGASQTCALGGLSDKDSWLFFKICAFGDRNLDNRSRELESAGQQIVTSLGGCPDAIQMIASVLSRRPDVGFWRNVHKSCEDLRNENDSISVVLRIIYQYLSPHLKLCLLHCSLYPRGHKFEKPNLIRCWVAGGFVLPREGMSIEDSAARSFDDLSSMPFFRLSRDRYILHDSVHDIASSQMFVFLCSGSDWLSRVPKQVVHLSLISDDIQVSEFEDLYGFNNLRSLLLMPRYSSRLDHLTEELLPAMKSLRMLELSHTGVKELPVSIGDLKHLRFLNLSHTRIKSLPESLANLRKLQILDLSGCIMLCSFPAWMNKICSLRHLIARPDLICTIEGIGKLSSLQSLEEFRVRENEGHKIEELKNMNELHGKLQIRNMENIKSEVEARGADLHDKVYLQGLELEWSDDRRDDDGLIGTSVDDEEILGGLRPPSNLKMISIKGFGGRKSPAWMRSLLSFSELQTICLKDCRKWEVLPPLGELPRLKFLQLCGMEGVRKVDNRTYGLGRFGSLAELRLHGLSRWDEWLGADDLFPALRLLEIKDCPMLRTMPPLPPALRELRIERVGLVTLHDTLRCGNEDGEESIYSAQPPTLSSIHIADCPSLASVRIGSFKSSATLEVLTIRRCECLCSFPTGWFHNLARLKSLVVEDCPRLLFPNSSLTSGHDNPGVDKRTRIQQVFVWPLAEDATSRIAEGCPSLFFLNSSLMSGNDNPSAKNWSALLASYLIYTISIVFPAQSTKNPGIVAWFLPSLAMIFCIIGMHQVYNWVLAEDAPSAKPTAALASSIKTLKIVGSPGIVGAPLFAELQTRKLAVTIAKAYTDLASCKQEALRHLTALQSMTVLCRESLLPSAASSVLLEYTMSRDGSSKVTVTVMELPPSDLFANSTAEIIGCDLQTLKHLELTDCPDITSFSDEQLDHLTALEDLTISSCCGLQSVQIRSFNCALKRLEIRNCTELSSFTVTPEDQEDQSTLQRPPTSLQSLVLHGCSSLLFLPANTRSLASLRALRIENCPQLRCLPDAGLPISLRELVIQQSPVAASRCRRESDPDWDKIAFIPNIDID